MTGIQVALAAGAAVLTGGLSGFFFGPRAVGRAEVRGGVQQVDVVVRGGYAPDVITVRQGVPLRLTLDRREGGDCTSRVVFPTSA